MPSGVQAITLDRRHIRPRAERDVQPSIFDGLETIAADAGEPWSASVLRTDETLVMPVGFPRTARRLRARGWSVAEIDLSELRKAEGGPSCLSILLRQPAT